MKTLLKNLGALLQKDSAVGILLIVTTLLAMLCANSHLEDYYRILLELPIEFRIGSVLQISKPLLLWINDGLMAIFFLLVGLEVKREALQGRLSSPREMLLPGLAAIGGMLVPALFYLLFNAGDEVARHGWAIPAATDIAFALGLLALLGDRVPDSLKIFLLALAIMDDLGAIIIIALFYSGDLSNGMLLLALACLVLLVVFNRLGLKQIAPYAMVGTLLWVFVLKSGVHATLAGVLIAFTIPLQGDPGKEAPLEILEHDLHPWVNFFILPVFAFANAGISFSGMTPTDLFQPVSLGIFLGLVAGKLIGVFCFALLAIRFGIARLPVGATLAQLFGVSALCGIGFTMSLFIGGLAFEHTGTDYFVAHRLGILMGSAVSGLLGLTLLHHATRKGSRKS